VDETRAVGDGPVRQSAAEHVAVDDDTHLRVIHSRELLDPHSSNRREGAHRLIQLVEGQIAKGVRVPADQRDAVLADGWDRDYLGLRTVTDTGGEGEEDRSERGDWTDRHDLRVES